jgi:hypothetical protein
MRLMIDLGLVQGALLLRENSDYNDLVSAVRRNLKESGPRITYIIDSIFNETDLNHDGYLSYDEFRQWATGKGKDDLHIDQWMDSLLPQRTATPRTHAIARNRTHARTQSHAHGVDDKSGG